MKRKFIEKASFKKLEGIALHDLYHVNSELNVFNGHKLEKLIRKAISDDEFEVENSKLEDLYPDSEKIILPQVDSVEMTENIFSTIKKRRSIRRFSKESISMEKFAIILKSSIGITGIYPRTENFQELKLYAIPTAGGLMSLKVYVSINNVDGIKRGFYYYNPFHNSLALIKYYETESDHLVFTMGKDIVKDSSFVCYIASDMDLTGYKYGDRGYRFINIEAGHLGQNLYLTSTALNCGCVALGGFYDEAIKNEIGEENYVLYEVVVGNPAHDDKDNRFL